ncbi:MAG: AraC family transcriptional regulator [Clostridiales bacterium]|jgi:hypothetical protein|nr:AraC family transcriptional regulator [Clostridiales bacterium]
MTVADIAALDAFRTLTGDIGMKNEITGAYAGDLLSWVMGKAKEGDCWITIQGHVNISAVASLAGVACVVVAENAVVNEEALRKAAEAGIPILTSRLPIYEICKLLAGIITR